MTPEALCRAVIADLSLARDMLGEIFNASGNTPISFFDDDFDGLEHRLSAVEVRLRKLVQQLNAATRKQGGWS